MKKDREGFILFIYPSPGEPPWTVLTREDVDEWRLMFPNDKTLDGLIRVSARHRKFPKGTRPRDLKMYMRDYLEDLARLEELESLSS